MAAGNTEAAAAAVADIVAQLRRTEEGAGDALAHAANLPHGAAVAAALKTAAHWTALCAAADAAAAPTPGLSAAELYARAAKLAEEAAASPAPAAATSALMAGLYK
jgi:hypothetical protein